MFSLASTLMAMAAVIAGVMLLIAGTVVSRAALAMIAIARASRQWSTSAGRVVRSEVRGNRAVIRYEYSVAGERYEGRDVGVGGWPYQTARSAERHVQEYPAGAQVTVYYDSGDPARVAILRPGISSDALYLPAVASLLLLIAIALLSWSVWRLLPR